MIIKIRKTFVICLVILSLLLLCPASYYAQDKEDESYIIPVDIVSGKIGDLNYRDGIEKIKESIGEKRIKKSIEYLEGNPSDVYLIDIDGHSISKHCNYVSFTDPVFKINNNLGVGLKVKEFKKIFGEYTYRYGTEGEGIYFSPKGYRYHFHVMVDDFDQIHFWELSESEILNRVDESVVNEITVW